MPKGYWIAHVDVTNPEGYKDYVALNAKDGAKFIVRGGKSTVKHGTARARHVVIEFESYDKALACYDSPEYRAAEIVRKKHSNGDVIVIEGYDG